MSSSRDEDRQQALSHHPQQDLVPPASRPSPPGDTSTEDYVGSSHHTNEPAGLGHLTALVARFALLRSRRAEFGDQDDPRGENRSNISSEFSRELSKSEAFYRKAINPIASAALECVWALIQRC